MGKNRINLIIYLLMAISCSLNAQPISRDHLSAGTIGGRVLDSAINKPIEYTNIVLYSARDSAQVSGTITDANGRFLLMGVRPGRYYIEFSFMGYQTKRVEDVEIRPPSMEMNLGDITLDRTAIDLDEVSVSYEKPFIEYKIDKKVINVSQEMTAASGTAVDVLESVPSVTVDIEGNVQLRGSGNFTVLIDGRPSVLESSDALQQIPASAIDNIEIITNPSAKYEPDGMSGIINVIMKKNQMRGVGGVVNLNSGWDEKYGGELLLTYRKGIANASFGADYNRRAFPGSMREENRTTYQGTTSYVYSDGDTERGRTMYGLRASLDLNVSSKDLIGLGIRWGGRKMDMTENTNYDEWSDSGLQHSLSISQSSSERSGRFYSAYMEYRHQFQDKGHELTGKFVLSHRNMKEESSNELFELNGVMTEGKESSESGPGDWVEAKVDYTRPVRENYKIESGYQGRMHRSEDASERNEYDPVLGIYQFQPQYSHMVGYNGNTHSLYVLHSGEPGKFGYQLGFRGEYTLRQIELIGENETFTLDRLDYFPTLHTSYQFSEKRQMMASYTRRIQRWRRWFLEPFETWTDAYNVHQGNPDLKPEYIDSFEAGYQTFLSKFFISTELYYRMTHNVVQFVRSVYDTNVTLHSVENVGTDYSLGVEMMFRGDILKWWNANLMGNLYDYRIEGTLYGEPFSQQSFDWRLRLNNSFKITRTTSMQVNGVYNSPSVSSQGEREGFYTVDLALKQEFLEGKLTATLQIDDVLQSSKQEFTSEGPDFYSYSYHTREAPIFMLNVSYYFNNYKKEREKRRTQEDIGEDDF